MLGATTSSTDQAKDHLAEAVKTQTASKQVRYWRGRFQREYRYALKQENRAGRAEARSRRLLRELSKLRGRHPSANVNGVPAHYRGWLCIHLGPSFNSTGPHEGNSWSGTYTGPLQMTNPWMGHRAPGGSWASIPMRAVFAIAEQESAKYGFSYSYMSGQWPNTYPPCARYF
jgi:hypothetical protein